MAKKKKNQSAEFAKDKNAFAGGSSKGKDVDTQKAKQKQSGAHQPRDADCFSVLPYRQADIPVAVHPAKMPLFP